MIDQFGRRIEYARISVTDRCNLRCRYCMPEFGVEKISHVDILTYEEILRVAKIFSQVGIRKIRLTGGEPLLRKNLPTLIKNLKNLDGIAQVTLTTNGVLLEKFAADLIAAGIDGINISVDTLDENVFANLTRRKLFGNVMRGLKIFLKSDCHVKINCVPLRGVNENDILKLAELARENTVDVRFIELMPIGCAENFQGIPTAEVFAQIEKHFGKLEPARTENFFKGPAEYFKPKNFVGRIGFIDAIEHKFCGSCNRIRLTAEGFLKPCLNFDVGLDVKKLLRGNVADEEILTAIEQTIYRKPREHFFEKSFGDARKMYQIGG